MPPSSTPAIYFPDAAAFRAWLTEHHATTTELLVGFYKKNARRTGVTYAEAVDEALCFGWIDGIIRRVDDERYTHRFTPRKPGSTWSLVNVDHIARLTQAGRMAPAGLAAFAARDPRKSGLYSFESAPQSFSPTEEKQLRADPAARAFYAAQPPGYRKNITHWIASAKRPDTRARRFARLLAACREGRRLS